MPTRWAITAVDSIIGDSLLEQVSKYDPVEEVRLYFSNLFDNYFFILFIPGPWAFEMVEAWAPYSFWARGKLVITSEGEYGRKRKSYAENVGGSYYAARLAVLEKLKKEKKVVSVAILREVREGYYMPLGVWQVRENVRRALSSDPYTFYSLEEALVFARERLGMRIEPYVWKSRSRILSGVQKRLF